MNDLDRFIKHIACFKKNDSIRENLINALNRFVKKEAIREVSTGEIKIYSLQNYEVRMSIHLLNELQLPTTK